jgi:peptidoglycan-associated lipoprotein
MCRVLAGISGKCPLFKLLRVFYPLYAVRDPCTLFRRNSMNKWSMYCCIIIVSFAFLAAGCTKRAALPDEDLLSNGRQSIAASPNQGESTTLAGNEETVVSDNLNGSSLSTTGTALAPIYFDFDSWLLSAEARETIRKNYEWLKAHPGKKITIEGHTDERGSDSYNLALGENRAKSAMKYVITLGADPTHVSIISYGEENPADPGQNEQAWAKNRRAEFVVQ